METLYARGRADVALTHPEDRASAWGSITEEQARSWLLAADDGDGARARTYSDDEVREYMAGVSSSLSPGM